MLPAAFACAFALAADAIAVCVVVQVKLIIA
jgi:hypothetical protein